MLLRLLLSPWGRVLCLLGFLSVGQAVAQQSDPAVQAAISTSGKIALLVDVKTGTTLINKESTRPFQPASLTKIMTAFMVFDALEAGKLRLDQRANVSVDAWRRGSGPSGAAAMMLAPKATPTVDELLRGLIVASGNDAAITLAEMLAGDENAFAKQMTAKARSLGAKQTQFANATGFAVEGQWTIATDQLLIAQALIAQHPDKLFYFSLTEFQWNIHRHRSRNPLLGTEGFSADGFTTGFIEGEGYSLVGSAVSGSRRLILVLAGIDSIGQRATEARRLMDWGFTNFEERTLFAPEKAIGIVNVFGGLQTTTTVAVAEPLRGLVPVKDVEKFQATIDYLAPVPAPVIKGQPIGTLHVRLGDTDFFKVPVVALENVPSMGVGRRSLSVIWDLTLWAIGAAFAPLSSGK